MKDLEHPGRWKSVDWEEYHKLFPRRVPGKGCLEVMARNITVHTTTYIDGIRVKSSRNVLTAPCILTHANASVTWRGINHACEHLALEKLIQLASRLHAITLADVPDNNSAMSRLKQFVTPMLPNNILYAPVGCNVHLIQRCLCGAWDMSKLAGDVHAIWKVTKHPGNRSKLLKAIRGLADNCLAIPGPPPNPMWKELAEGILKHGLLRVMDHATGAVTRIPVPAVGLEEDVDRSDGDEPFRARRQAVAVVLQLLNGDWQSERLMHYCDGCCASEEDAKNNVYSAVVQGGLVWGFADTEPSTSRWGSTSQSLAEQTVGVCCHQILPQALAKAFAIWKDGEVDAAAEPKRGRTEEAPEKGLASQDMYGGFRLDVAAIHIFFLLRADRLPVVTSHMVGLSHMRHMRLDGPPT